VIAASRRSLHRLALWTTVGLVILLAAGASVNSLGGALSVPDWPLSYGRVLPLNFVGHATHEQAHRLAAGVLVVLMAFLWAAVARAERRRWVRTIGFWTVALYYAQVLLGGVVVLALSPPGVVPLHLLLAMITLGLAAVLTMVTSAEWVEEAPGMAAGSSVPRLVTSVLHLAVGQIVLGTLSRHPPAGQGLFISTLLLHLAGALAIAVLAGVLVIACGRGGVPDELRKGAGVLLLLIILQLGVGMPLFVVAPEPFSEVWQAPRSFSYLHITHVVLAGLVLAQAAALKVRLMRAATTAQA
jgi:cytochrome c oxidase assembly protein subunit 15